MFLKKNHNERLRRLSYVVFGLSVATGLEFLVWGYRGGLGFFLFTLLFCFGFIFITHYTRRICHPYGLLLGLPAVVISFDVFFYNNYLVQIWAPFFVFVLLFAMVFITTVEKQPGLFFALKNIRFVQSLQDSFSKWKVVFQDVLHWKTKNKYSEALKKIGKGLLFSLPLVIIFGSLFYAADAIFADITNKVFHFDIDPIVFLHIVRIVFFASLLSAIFYVLIGETHSLHDRKWKIKKLDNVVTSVVLGVLNILFAIFVFIQFAYLFGNSEYVLKTGISFADYARNGFFQLVWIIILSAILLITVYRSSDEHKANRIVDLFQVVFIAQVCVVAASALRRMYLYQEVYGFTTLRLYVEWFIYYAIIVLIFAALGILLRQSFRKFFYSSVILGVMAITWVCSVNVDYRIAKENIGRYIQGKNGLDMLQLTQELSLDTLPAMQSLSQEEMGRNLNIFELKNMGDYLKKREMDLRNRAGATEFHIGTYRALKSYLELEHFYGEKVRDANRKFALFYDFDKYLSSVSRPPQNQFSKVGVPSLLHYQYAYSEVEENSHFITVLYFPERNYLKEDGNFEQNAIVRLYNTHYDEHTLKTTYDLIGEEKYPLAREKMPYRLHYQDYDVYESYIKSNFYVLTNGSFVMLNVWDGQNVYYKPMIQGDQYLGLQKISFRNLSELKKLVGVLR